MFDNAVHLLLKLGIQRAETITHVALLAQLLNDNPIQRHTPFFQTLRGALIDPRQIATQRSLIIDRFLARGVIDLNGAAVELHVASGGNFEVAIAANHLHALRTHHHVILWLHAAFVSGLRLNGGQHQHRRQCFSNHAFS